MSQTPEFKWLNEKDALCTLKYKGMDFCGLAECHPDDMDFVSEKTGCEYAFMRAQIKVLRYHRDNEVKPALAALKQLYYSMNTSKKFNENSYENKMLQRQIHQFETELATVNQMLVQLQESLRETIKEKDKFYKKIRSIRNKAETD